MRSRPDILKGIHPWAIIARVMERGNETEKQEIAQFYNINPAQLTDYKPTNALPNKTERNLLFEY